jgi:hypothetical protein
MVDNYKKIEMMNSNLPSNYFKILNKENNISCFLKNYPFF